MKKRSLAVLMAGIMAASMMTGVVSVYADADSKTLTVGFDAEYPPFGYKDDNGDYVGFDLDLGVCASSQLVSQLCTCEWYWFSFHAGPC